MNWNKQTKQIAAYPAEKERYNCNSNHNSTNQNCNGLTSFAISFRKYATVARCLFWLAILLLRFSFFFGYLLGFMQFFAPHILAAKHNIQTEPVSFSKWLTIAFCEAIIYKIYIMNVIANNGGNNNNNNKNRVANSTIHVKSEKSPVYMRGICLIVRNFNKIELLFHSSCTTSIFGQKRPW